MHISNACCNQCKHTHTKIQKPLAAPDVTEDVDGSNTQKTHTQHVPILPIIVVDSAPQLGGLRARFSGISTQHSGQGCSSPPSPTTPAAVLLVPTATLPSHTSQATAQPLLLPAWPPKGASTPLPLMHCSAKCTMSGRGWLQRARRGAASGASAAAATKPAVSGRALSQMHSAAGGAGAALMCCCSAATAAGERTAKLLNRASSACSACRRAVCSSAIVVTVAVIAYSTRVAY
jgi:hypothetical protein